MDLAQLFLIKITLGVILLFNLKCISMAQFYKGQCPKQGKQCNGCQFVDDCSEMPNGLFYIGGSHTMECTGTDVCDSLLEEPKCEKGGICRYKKFTCPSNLGEEDVYFPDPFSCVEYHVCKGGDTLDYACEEKNTAYNPEKHTCDDSDLSTCQTSPIPFCKKDGDKGIIKGTNFVYTCKEEMDPFHIIYPLIEPTPTTSPSPEMETSPSPGTSIKTSPPAGTSMETSPPAGTSMETSPPAGTSMETSTSAGTSIKTSPPAGTSMETSTSAGTSIKTSPPAGTSMETSPSPGTSMETSTSAGTSMETSTSAGTSIKTSPPAGTSMETSPSPGTSMETSPSSEHTTVTPSFTDMTTKMPFSCSKAGYFADSDDCRKYYICYQLQNSSWAYVEKMCRPGSYFNETQQMCVKGYCSHYPSSTSPAAMETTTSPCNRDGYFPDIHCCRCYYICASNGNGFNYAYKCCRRGSHFDASLQSCVKSEDCTPTDGCH